MASNAERVALDTSVAVAYLQEENTLHPAVLARLGGATGHLAGHAEFEAFSVLTRLPPEVRLSGHDARLALEESFGPSVHLRPETAARLLEEFAREGVVGGAVFDGLVAATARAHGLLLLSCDRRAAATYRRLGVDFELILGDR